MAVVDSQENLDMDIVAEQELVKLQRQMGKEIDLVRAKAVSDVQRHAKILNENKTIAMLENKLEVAMKKFNIVVAENIQLRKEIDHLLAERAHFNSLWDKLINNLNEGKRFMLDIIEQATLAYDQREEWCAKLAALRARANQDVILHTKELRNLQRKLDHDAKLHEFLGTKGKKRILADLEAREARKEQHAKENMEKQLALYRDTLQQIQDFCGETDIERLAAQYIKQEEENFALFNYVNELNHESELLSIAIQELKNDIEEQRELNLQKETQQKDDVANLEGKLKDVLVEAENGQENFKNANKEMGTVLTGIENIFKLLQGNEVPILELLGENSTVNEYNVKMYLGLIEKQAAELVQANFSIEKVTIENTKKSKGVTLSKPDAAAKQKPSNPKQTVAQTEISSA